MIEFTTTFSKQGQPVSKRSEDTNRFTILLIGPFAGDAITPFSEPAIVDLDSFATIMKKTAPSVQLDTEKLVFKQITDFEPLMLAQSHSGPSRWFSWLSAVRTGGPNCPAASEALAALEEKTSSAEDAPSIEATPPEQPETGHSSFEDLLTGSSTISPEPTHIPSNSIVDKLISETVSGSSKPPENADELLNAISGMLGEQLRLLYHNPLFRELETAWLALDEMIGDFDSDDPVRFLFFPFNRDDWNNFLQDTEDSTGMRARLKETCPENPDIIVTTEEVPVGFDQENALQVLTGLNKQFDCQVIANANFNDLLRGTPSGPVTQADLVDQSPFPSLAEAASKPSIRLVTPRFRIRLPYGEDWNPAGSFVFEEFLPGDSMECLPWAPASLLCAHAWASKYREDEESTNWGEVTRMAGFPPLTGTNGNSTSIPATEYFLTENAMVHLYRMGFLPITAMRNSDHILVGA